MGNRNPCIMPSLRYSLPAALLSLLVIALAGCSGGSGVSGTGSTGGSGGSGSGGGVSTFQPRPFPGDYFVIPPTPQAGATAYPPDNVTAPQGNIAYDAALNEFFFSNPSMNEVEAYSSIDGRRLGAVTIPGSVNLSISPDGTQMAVGTDLSHIYLVNLATLHVTNEITVPATLLNPAQVAELVEPFLMASGPMLIAAVAGGNSTLIAYDASTGAFTHMNPTGSTTGTYGPVETARSQDGNYLAVLSSGSVAAQLSVYSAATQTFIGTTPGLFNISSIAANPDGSQFVTVGYPTSSGGGPYITFWSRSLQQEAQYATSATNAVYSRDGKYLYAVEQGDVLALNTQTGKPAGYQGLTISTTLPWAIYDTDDANRVYGLTYQGAFVASVAQLQPTPPLTPEFDGLPFAGNPPEGPLSGGTKVQFAPFPPGTATSNGITSATEAYFGSVPAINDVVAPDSPSSSLTALTATTPAVSTGGPVSVLLTDADNNAAFIPRAYSYGPHLITFNPSAIPPNGPLTLVTDSELTADGIISDPPTNMPQVSIGGTGATVTPLASSGSPNSVEVSIPPGNPGWADLKMTLPDGSTETTKNLVQFLSQDATLTSPAYTAAVYDPARDRFYLTGADNTIGVFDPQTQTLLQPMTSPSISSGAVLGSLALTPDDSKLLVSDPTDHSVVVFNLTDGSSSAVSLTIPSNITTLSAPMPVAALSGNRALVIVISPGALDEVQEIDLTNMTAQVRTDVPSESVYGFGQPSSIAASTDGNVALLSAGGLGYSEAAAWKYDTASDTFSAPKIIPSTVGDDVAVNADGTVLAVGSLTLDQNLMPLVSYPSNVGLLTASGALNFTPDPIIYVSDTHNGRIQLTVGTLDTFPNKLALAIGPDGRKILECDGTSLHYYELAVVPLAVATVTPAAAPPGSSLTIRGDGFVTGTTVKIGGQSASCTMTDTHTLQCAVPNVNTGLQPMTLTNPDGQTYSFEAAVNVQ